MEHEALEGNHPVAVTLLAYVSHVVWALNDGSWYSLKVTNGVVSVATGPTAVSPLTVAITANRTEDILGILGVQGKIGESSAPYVNATGVAADATYIGARLFRDDLGATNATQIAALQALYNAGIRFVASPPGGATLVIANLITVLKQWLAFGSDAIVAIEGPNEPFYAPITYNGNAGGGGGDWTAVANFQRDWRIAIRGDSALSAIPVLSPSQVGHENPNVGLQFAVVPSGSAATFPANTAFWDGAAVYVLTAIDDGVTQTIDEAGDHIMARLRRDFVTTETGGYSGYTDAQILARPRYCLELIVNAGGGITIPDAVRGKSLLNGLLNLYKDGYRLACMYELYNINSDATGLFSGTGAPLAPATYLHNFAGIMNDPGTATRKTFTPGSLAVTVTGLPSTGRWHLFQKTTGTWFIVLWSNVSLWQNGQAVTVPASSVTVNFPLTGNSTIWDPSIGSNPSSVSSVTNISSVTVSVSDHAMVVAFVSTSV
jgi:hypothetical protein